MAHGMVWLHVIIVVLSSLVTVGAAQQAYGCSSSPGKSTPMYGGQSKRHYITSDDLQVHHMVFAHSVKNDTPAVVHVWLKWLRRREAGEHSLVIRGFVFPEDATAPHFFNAQAARLDKLRLWIPHLYLEPIQAKGEKQKPISAFTVLSTKTAEEAIFVELKIPLSAAAGNAFRVRLQGTNIFYPVRFPATAGAFGQWQPHGRCIQAMYPILPTAHEPRFTPIAVPSTIHNVRYHAAMGINTTRLYCTLEHIQLFQEHPAVQPLVESGALQLLLWTDLPMVAFEPGCGVAEVLIAYYSQIISHQHALLAAWGTGCSLLLIDPDEYISTNAPISRSIVDELLPKGDFSAIKVNRFNVFCAECLEGKTTDQQLWTSEDALAEKLPHPLVNYGLHDPTVHRLPKLLVNPENVFCLHVHKAHIIEGRPEMQMWNRGHIMHVRCLWKRRTFRADEFQVYRAHMWFFKPRTLSMPMCVAERGGARQSGMAVSHRRSS